VHNGFKVGMREIAPVLIALSLVACGGTSNTTANPSTPSTSPTGIQSPPPPPPPPSSTPSISGTPSTAAMVGQPYSFQPSASDTDSTRLTFTISRTPAWAQFDSSTGHLWGTPQAADLGVQAQIVISVSDGTHTKALPEFSLTVIQARKSDYGHYFSTQYTDSPAVAATLCEQVGVSGVVWHRTWSDVEPSEGVYDFSSYDKVLTTIAASRNPSCHLWLFIDFKSFSTSPVKNPCPTYLQAKYSALNSYGNGASTCFMWDPAVVSAYTAMLQAAAAHFDSNPQIEGVILQESALALDGAYSQDVADGGTYTAAAWRDALINIISQCANAFATSRCTPFLNFLRGGQSYLYDISAAITAIPNNQVCFSGPDLLPDSPSLYSSSSAVYQVLTRHTGCRSNSAQNNSYQVPGCALTCIFEFAVGGTFGGFLASAPLTSGLCVNSYIFWNDKTSMSSTGLTYKDALPVIAAHPYGPDWYDRCSGSSSPP
jgi:Putative Ig domain